MIVPKFLKYPKIKHSALFNRDDYSDKALEQIEKCDWLLTLKIDGANVQFLFTPEGDIHISSRNKYLGTINSHENFYGIDEILTATSYINLFDSLRDYSKSHNKNLRFYGELYGKFINKRKNYPKIGLRFFDIYEDDNPTPIVNLYTKYNIKLNTEFSAPILDKTTKIEFALNRKCNVLDLLSKTTEKAEGFIIRPYNTVIYDKHGNQCIFKKKPNTEIDYYDKDQLVLNDDKYNTIYIIFENMLNEDRLTDYESKYGPLSQYSQLVSYTINLFEDAYEDFVEFYNFKFPTDFKKWLFNKARYHINTILNQRLKERRKMNGQTFY